MMAIMTLALFPLGLIALLASLESARTADSQRRADLRVAVVESTRKLSAELASDVSAFRAATDALTRGADPAEVCARLGAILAAHTAQPTPFALFGPGAEPLCAAPGFRAQRPSTLSLDSSPRAQLSEDYLDVEVQAPTGAAVAIARYDKSKLANFARPNNLTGNFGVTLNDDTASMVLIEPEHSLSIRGDANAAAVGLLGLSLSISTAMIAFGPTQALLTFLPLLMWASASIIAFLLADRLLIRPLRQLRLAVADHAPGAAFVFPSARTPAREIRELGDTFVESGEAIVAREASLAKALADQTRATREVHHRVKNNLQVVASLISLHARSAGSPDAANAFAVIQRRVDALAIVHRNHYAELDSGGGIEVRALLSELAANLRANAGEGASPPISIGSPLAQVTQDTAVAVAFLLTELAELSMTLDASAPITIEVKAVDDNPEKAFLRLTSAALRSGDAMEATLAARYARILEGLSRQLRSRLERQPEIGSFAIEFPLLSPRQEK